MARDDAFAVEGTVIDVLSDRLFRLELANGHRLLAHGSKRDLVRLAAVRPGDRLTVLVSTFDLSKGAIQPG